MAGDAKSELAPHGKLRAAINMGNMLLVTGKTASGDPDGVSPDMAREIAHRLGVAVELVPFASPGELADAGGKDIWDIGLIAEEPARAEAIKFSPAYVEIEATYLVPPGSSFKSVAAVDSQGTRIAVSARAAYDLYLTRSVKNAELVRGQGIAGTFEMFKADKLDAMAGLRPALLDDAKKLPGSRVLDGKFTAVQQAIGTAKPNAAFPAQWDPKLGIHVT